MSFDLSKSEKRLEYGQIILGHIDKILKLSLVILIVISLVDTKARF